MAFVVVMHLSPDHESSLQAIIQRACGFPTVAVTRATSIEVDHVYVISPSKKLVMTDGQLLVTDLTTLEGRRRSIDFFFRSLAEAHRERAVCVVLSGTGADGTQGLKRIKELGGVTLVQSPEDAKFDGMPRSAKLAQTRLFDVVVSDVAMPEYDGHWLATELRSADETRNLPIIAVSGRSRDADRQKAIERGFDAHVGKPLTLEELRNAVGRVIDQRRQSGGR